jgi:uncharacterized RDD family membrane protein YckC
VVILELVIKNKKNITMVYLVRRFAALYLDLLIVMMLMYILYSLYFLSKGVDIGDIKQPSASLSSLLQFISAFFYFLFFEFFVERTIGKMIFKFKILGFHEMVGFKRLIQVLKRTLVRLFPLDPFSIFLNEEYKTWHDQVSKTRVVDARNESKHV